MTDYKLKNVEYICVEKADVLAYLGPKEQHMLFALIGMVNNGRTVNQKPPLRLSIKDLRNPSNVG